MSGGLDVARAVVTLVVIPSHDVWTCKLTFAPVSLVNLVSIAFSVAGPRSPTIDQTVMVLPAPEGVPIAPVAAVLFVVLPAQALSARTVAVPIAPIAVKRVVRNLSPHC